MRSVRTALKTAILCLCAAGLLALPASCGALRAVRPLPGGARSLESGAAAERFSAAARRSMAATLSPANGSACATLAQPTGTPCVDAQEAAACFEEIAFCSEYGGDRGAIRKWMRRASIRAQGEYTPEDMAALRRAVEGLNAVAGFPGLSFAQEQADIEVYFVPLEQMGGRVPEYVQGNWGFFVTYSNGAGISGARIAIATDVTDQQARNHLIYEELLQSTGLMQDSYRHEDSIFYGNWTTVQQPTALDWELLRLLYLPQISHGMAQRGAMELVREELGLVQR